MNNSNTISLSDRRLNDEQKFQSKYALAALKIHATLGRAVSFVTFPFRKLGDMLSNTSAFEREWERVKDQPTLRTPGSINDPTWHRLQIH